MFPRESTSSLVKTIAADPSNSANPKQDKYTKNHLRHIRIRLPMTKRKRKILVADREKDTLCTEEQQCQ